jgi:hypothetical protein
MQRNNRFKTFRFPYLAGFTTDYLNSFFKLQVSYKTSNKNIEIKSIYDINNNELLNQINTGNLVVILKISCSSTAFLKTIPFPASLNEIVTPFETQDFEGEVDFISYIIAAKEFKLSNKDLSEFWKNENPVINKDNVIGESNESTIILNHVKSGSKKSIFNFVPDSSKQDGDSFHYLLDDNNSIVFKLSQTSYKSLNQIKHQNNYFIVSSLIFPVLSDILRQMINTQYPETSDFENEFNSNHSRKRWYIVIQEKYSKAFPGIDPCKQNEAIDPIKAAQILTNELAVNNLLSIASKLSQGE